MVDEVQKDVETQEAKRELAVITGVRYGMNNEQIGMVYGVKLLAGETALFMNSLEVDELVKKHQIMDIAALKGAPCVVTTSDQAVTFVELT